jgi:meso-butanediol dehydrogenase / (S,S)-butanediol dehydrogenase / diacetyl reductase
MQTKTLIIVGADRRSGINGMLAETAAGRGWIVVCVGMKSSGDELVAAIRDAGGEAVFHRGDGGDRAFMDRIVALTVEKYGKIDALVVGSAVAPPDDTFERITRENATALFWANVGAAVAATQAIMPQLKKQGGGAIVLVGTANVDLGQYGQTLYSMTKSALYTLVRQLTVKYARFGIRVNIVTPSTTPNLTETWERRRQMYGDDLVRSLAERRPSRRLSTPAAVAKTILLLLSDDAEDVFGNELKIDGGESVAGGDLADDDWQAEIVAKWRRSRSERERNKNVTETALQRPLRVS